MRIAGIDPGLNATGYGAIEVSNGEVRLLEGGVIRPGSAKEPLESRLAALYDGIVEILTEFRPEAVALEKLYSNYEHPSTAILMGHARGVICLASSQNGVSVYNYAATEIKSCLTGNGRASKEQMQRAIQLRLKLKEAPSPHDVADALAAAICHYWTVSSPVMAAVGDLQRIDDTMRMP
ncbi:MAG: crossover junction endodeoxyribonuclease RuvC [Dehalococcoidia bacterium]